jgi:AraC-like DNA-binding protein
MKDYAIYLPMAPETQPWQAAVTGAGYARVPAGSPYPPGRHPLDHLFTWQRGRILQAYQVVYILRGSGVFESAHTHPQQVAKGSLLLLFPGVWHRYSPNPRTGWVESWIELQGPALDRLERGGVFSPRRPLLHVGRHGPLETVFDQCHRFITALQPGHQSVLSALGLQILAWLQVAMVAPPSSTPSVEEAVRQTQLALSANLDRQINMEDFAEQLHVSYSAMRHAFKHRFGLSPKQYHLQLRLRKARELLQNTDLTLDQISRALGFGSPFHLSSIFKQHVGKCPTTWRRRSEKRKAR